MKRPRRSSRTAAALVAAGAAVATALGTLLLPALAFADDSGGESSGSGAGAAMLRIGIATIVLLLVIGFLATLPRLLHRPRYRPGKPWPFDPLWFSGPENPEAALAGTRPLRGNGGASADW